VPKGLQWGISKNEQTYKNEMEIFRKIEVLNR
jgi:hypothetical protein